jgi:hypothetical protein
MTSETWADIALPALLRHARATYGNAMRDALAERGYDDIPGNGLYVIGALAIGEAPLGQIIRELRVSKQAGGQLVDALVLRGYLVRETDPDDRRKLTVDCAAAPSRWSGDISARKVEHPALAQLPWPTFSRYSSSHGVLLSGIGGAGSALRRAISSGSTSASQLPALRSMRIVSPVRSQASPPPAALSGEALRIEGLSDVPDWRPSPSVGRLMMPCWMM